MALQHDVDALGHQEIDPRFEIVLRAVLAEAGEVRLVPVGDRAPVRVGVEVPLHPGGDVADAASIGSATGVGKRHEVPAPFIEGVGSVRAKGHGAPIAMRPATVEVLQGIAVLPVLVMVRPQDRIHLWNVRAPLPIEVAVELRHRAVLVLIVAQAENDVRFGRLRRRGDRGR